jgi:hypothetical protein
MNDLDHARIRPPRRLPSVQDQAAAGPAPSDLAWENELVLLLSTLESFRTALAECCHRSEGVPALETMLAMGGCLTGFVDRHPDAVPGEALQDLRGRGEAFAALGGKLHNRLRPTTLGAIRRLLGRRSGGGDPHAQFVEVARSLDGLLARSFELFMERFASPGMARAWTETSTVFLGQLRGLIDEL